MKKECHKCHSFNIRTTSVSPGDGRPKYICLNCKKQWTEGKLFGQGYKRKA